MTTRRSRGAVLRPRRAAGAWAVRAGLVVALVSGMLAGTAGPAQADHALRARVDPNGIDLQVGGGPRNVTISVENPDNHNPVEDGTAQNVQLTLTVPLTDLGVHIATVPSDAQSNCTRSGNDTRMDCTITEILAGQAWRGVVQIGVHGNSSLQAGESRNDKAKVVLAAGERNAELDIRLQGPERAPTVAEVSGFVTDEQTGEPIEGARVILVDSQGADFTRTSNASGEYRFTDEQIAPGPIILRASLDGYEGQERTETAQAGARLTDIQLTLRSTTTPTPSATPTATTAAPATGTASAVPVAAPASGRSAFTTIMIILGILFVLLGIGAIVLMIYRRRKGDDGPEGAGSPISGPPRPPRPPTPGARGRYGGAPTQVMGAGAGPMPAVGPQPGLADATTRIHPRAAEETTMLPRVDDPPGPRPPVPGSPPPPRAAAPTYGGAAAPPHGGAPSPPYGGAPGPAYGGAPGPAYGGAGAAGYDDPPGPAHGGPGAAGYDDPPGRHASPAGGHDTPTYRDPQYGRAEQAGYGSAREREGYGSDPYPPPPPSGPGYDQPGRSRSRHRDYGEAGYDSSGSTGYDRYDSGSGYGNPGHDEGSDPNYGRSGDSGYGRSGSTGYDRSGETGYDRYGSGYDRNAPGSGYDRPAPDAGYDRSAPGGGYDRPPPGSGYDRPAPGGGYDRSAPGGSGQDGYDRSGYGDAGYRDPGPDDTRYDGYDPDQYQEPRHAEPPERRRLDWLDG